MRIIETEASADLFIRFVHNTKRYKVEIFISDEEIHFVAILTGMGEAQNMEAGHLLHWWCHRHVRALRHRHHMKR